MVLVLCGYSSFAELSSYEQRNFSGLQSKGQNFMITDSGASDLLNIDFDSTGAIYKRKGWEQFGSSTSSENSLGIYTFKKKDGTQIILSATERGVYVSTALTNTKIISFNALATEIDFATFQGTGVQKCYIVNGKEFFSYDGTTTVDMLSLITSSNFPVSGSALEVFANKLYLTGNKDLPSTIFWSDLNNGDKWSAVSYEPINDNEGEKLIGMSSLTNGLICFKKNKIYALSVDENNDLARVTQLNSNNGAISNRAIVRYANGIVYLSYDGIYFLSYDNASNQPSDVVFSNMISGDISDKFEGAFLTGTQDQSMILFDKKILCSMYVPSYFGYRTMVFSTENKAWSIWDTDSAGYCTYEKDNETLLLGVDRDQFLIRKYNTGYMDGGVPINAYFTTKYYDFGGISDVKLLRKIYVAYSSSPTTMNIDVIPDFKDYATDVVEEYTVGNGTYFDVSEFDRGYMYDSVASSGIFRKDILGQSGRVFRFIFRNSEPYSWFGILGFKVFYTSIKEM